MNGKKNLKDFVNDIIALNNNYNGTELYYQEDLEYDFSVVMEKWSKKIEHYKWGEEIMKKKIIIEDLLQLAQRFQLRIVIEKHGVAFIHHSTCKTVTFYDNVLKKLDIYDIETSIRFMIGGKNEEDQEDTETETKNDENPS